VLFNSLTFVVFFIIVLLLHNALFSWRVKKTNLLIGSYSAGIIRRSKLPVLVVPIQDS